MTKLQHTGQAGGAEGARADTNAVTPAEAKRIWEFLEEPASRSIAEWFTARGRPVDYQTILQWKRAEWADSSAMDIAKAAGASNANAKAAHKPCAPPDVRSNADHAEEALLTVLACATSVFESLRNAGTAVPGASAVGAADDRPVLLLAEPDGITELMTAASTAIDTAVEGLKLLAALRAEKSVSVPGLTGPRPSRH